MERNLKDLGHSKYYVLPLAGTWWHVLIVFLWSHILFVWSDLAPTIHLSQKFLEVSVLILCLLQTLHLRAHTIFPLAITILHSSHMTLLNSLLRSCFHFLNIKLNVLQLSSVFCSSIIIFIHLFILSFHYLFTITNAWLLSMDISIFYQLPLFFVQKTTDCYMLFWTLH